VIPGAILCDLDGVLIESAGSCIRVWDAWAARNGLDGAAVRAFLHGRPSREVVAHFLPGAGAQAEGEELDRIQAQDTEGVVALPGAAELLAAPPAPLAIVTSCTAPLAAARLQTVGLPAPEVLVTSDLLSRGKPDPEGYLLGAARLGVDPGACVVLEDAPAGVTAGIAAGCVVVAVLTTHEASELLAAHAVIPGLPDLPQALASL
jgi:sugar-phosphatase